MLENLANEKLQGQLTPKLLAGPTFCGHVNSDALGRHSTPRSHPSAVAWSILVRPRSASRAGARPPGCGRQALKPLTRLQLQIFTIRVTETNGTTGDSPLLSTPSPASSRTMVTPTDEPSSLDYPARYLSRASTRLRRGCTLLQSACRIYPWQ